MIQPPQCPYCQQPAELVSATQVFGPRGRGNLWLCPNYPICDSFVGVHDGPLPRPKGTMANASLRALRIKVNAALGAQWQVTSDGKRRERGRTHARYRAYTRLAEEMGLKGREINIGEFDVEQCIKALMALGTPVEEFTR